MKHVLATVAICSIVALATPAQAREIVVQLRDKGGDGMMVFEPAYIRANPGDTIRFHPNTPSHNAETMATMLPAGAAPMKGPMGKDVVLTAKVPGLYGIKCMPHYSMGMVALVQVGKVTPAQVAAAKAVSLPPLATRRMTASLAKVK